MHVAVAWSLNYKHTAITKEDVNWNKKSYIKMPKTALFDCVINEKCCSVDGGWGICPLFSSPPQGIWQLKSHARGLPGRRGVWGCGGWVQLESGIERCINTPKEKVSCCRMVSGSRYSSWSFRICKRVSRNRFLKLLYLRCLKCVAIAFYALGPNFEKEDFCISNLES